MKMLMIITDIIDIIIDGTLIGLLGMIIIVSSIQI